MLFILSLSEACNIEKRIEKSQETFDRIGKRWLAQNPCANDSTFIYVPGKRDSVYLEVPIVIKDSTSLQIIIDSIESVLSKKYISSDKDCKKRIADSYRAGYNYANKEWANKLSNTKVPTLNVDSIKISLKDKQYIQLLQSDLSSANQKANDLKIELEKIKGNKKSWFLLFLLASFVALVSIYINIRKLFL